MSTRQPAPIAVEAVEVVYRTGVRALKPTSLAFEAGAFTVLLGASGAGKSTLLRSLNGLVTPTAGQVLADGLPIVGARALRHHRSQTGMVFQQHQLIGRVNVLGNVLTGRLGHHSVWRTLFPLSRAERIAGLDALDRVGLIDMALRRADQLSGGQQQRVGIARALVQKPRVLLADEPVASLDPTTAESVLALLHGIAREDGLTAIVSLHQLDFARRFGDRIIGLANGEVVFDGPPSALGAEEIIRIYGSNAGSQTSNDPAPEEIAA